MTLLHNPADASNDGLFIPSNLWQKHRAWFTIAVTTSLNDINLFQVIEAVVPSADPINLWCEWWLKVLVTFQLLQGNIGMSIFVRNFAQGIVNVQSISLHNGHFFHKVAVGK